MVCYSIEVHACVASDEIWYNEALKSVITHRNVMNLGDYFFVAMTTWDGKGHRVFEDWMKLISQMGWEDIPANVLLCLRRGVHIF